MAHVLPAVDQHPSGPFPPDGCPTTHPHSATVVLPGIVMTQGQYSALYRVEPHAVGLGPLIRTAQIPLQSLPTLQQIDTPTQVGVICERAESILDPLFQIIGNDIKLDQPQY
ncbi:integral membrane protein dgcr2 idd [Pitangus sulphuratus]|nr:integral membrane protein dgcr2 idd [Pitangus sulphuratus]